jgi:hypothetical protein
MSVLPVQAANGPAPGRDGAGAPVDGWVEIAPGETHWYKFKYSYDNSKDDNEPSQALVIMKAGGDPQHLGFMIETPGNLALPKKDDDGRLRQSVGVGSPMSWSIHDEDATEEEREREEQLADENGLIHDWTTLVWSGSAKAKETFYVLVKNSGTAPQTYKLSISGPDVSY